MLKGLTWEEETRARIGREKAELELVEAELKRVERIRQHLASRIKALEEALRLEMLGLAGDGRTEKKDFRTMSINSALQEIAKDHGGVVGISAKNALESIA